MVRATAKGVNTTNALRFRGLSIWEHNPARGELWRSDGALAVTQEAVDLYRELAASQPVAFRPDLAWALDNLAFFLNELGRRDEALAAAQEAETIRRDLAGG